MCVCNREMIVCRPVCVCNREMIGGCRPVCVCDREMTGCRPVCVCNREMTGCRRVYECCIQPVTLCFHFLFPPLQPKQKPQTAW